MARTPKADPMEAARALVRALAPPRSQAEWRNVSTVLRACSRLNRERKVGFTAKVEVSPRRYLYTDTCCAGVGCYTGRYPVYALMMAADARRKHADGWSGDRLRDARSWLRYSRDHRPTLPA